MTKGTKRIICLLLVCVLLASLGYIGVQFASYRRSAELYAAVGQTAGITQEQIDQAAAAFDNAAEYQSEAPPQSLDAEPSPPLVRGRVNPYARLLAKTDFTALQKQNADTCGWLLIPETGISYPIVQGEDNERYLTYGFDGSSSAHGAIFLHYLNDQRLRNFNTIIYGHNMNDSSMFAKLNRYLRQSYINNNADLYLATADGVYHYVIFAAYRDNNYSDGYRLSFTADDDKQAWLEGAVARSAVASDTETAADDRFLTLSTCTSTGKDIRTIVHAVQVGFTSMETAQGPDPDPNEM